jgi:hypothetical protein
MRHRSSLLASLEGMSRPAFFIARELAGNSRSGLTVRFLSKKLELPAEEVEYLIEVNHRLMFTDLTRIKLVPEGQSAVRRIQDGLENHGDIPSLMRSVKSLSGHEFRQFEELMGFEEPSAKKAAAEAFVKTHYLHPDSIVSYVATRGFSAGARELFDLLWQSKNGVMPVSQLRVARGGPEFEAEQALWELFRGFACFELFRFDSEDRLVRNAALLSEIRQYRDTANRHKSGKVRLKAVSGAVENEQVNALNFSDRIAQLTAAAAARPVRLRSDGDLFREDRRRLAEICPEETDPSLDTCLWVAEGAEWMARVDNTLRGGILDTLIPMDRVSRHRALFDWMVRKGDDAATRHLFQDLIEDIKPETWYPVIEFIRYAVQLSARDEQPVLKAGGAHWSYISPSASGQTENRLARALEETFFWAGIVDRAEKDGNTLFRLSRLGEALLSGRKSPELNKAFPPRKGEIIVQPNFEIVVPVQDMDPLITVPLDQFAERASTGQATVYRVTRDTFTQAVQEGRDASAFAAFLLAHNKGGDLPANVTQTLEDWRGSIKRVRLRTLHILESEDPLVMADLMHRKKLKKHFSALDTEKTVQYTGISKKELAKMLEKEGFIVK